MSLDTGGTPPAFGEASSDRSGPAGFDRLGVGLGLALVAVLLAGLLWAATGGTATAARHPRLFGGSLVLDGTASVTVLEPATAQITVQLPDIFQSVDASSYGQVQAVPTRAGTYLVNRATGTFNLLQPDNYVADPTGGGVTLGRVPGASGAVGLADGDDAYILRYAPHASVGLIDPATVQQATPATAGGTPASRSGRSPTAGTPRGLLSLPGPVPRHPGATVVAGGDLWALVRGGDRCSLVRVQPDARRRSGLGGATVARGVPCASALAAAGGVVGLTGPRGVTLLHGDAHRRLGAPELAGATAVVPVADTPPGRLWWLVRLPSGWASFGAGPTATSGPHVLRGMPATADPAPPVESAGGVYTLDRRASGQPALWVLDPASGAVGTVSGLARYPAKSRVERASFTGAELLVDGPRVVYNNPGSLLAVVVFTDGSHRPVVVDKASAVDVDASGPVAIARTAARHGHGRGRHGKGRPRAAGPAQPARHGAGPTVDEQLRCADTTQKPYAPVVQPVSASSESALVSWSYVLLDEQDCEPDSWVVRLTALDGSPPPLQPTTVVRGQQQAEIGGLRPSTTYAAVVVAVINHQQTASQPVTFRTTAEGPEAPSSVTTRVEADGSWLVSWAPCQGAACYVPAAQWYVIATACGGSFAGQPPDATVPGGSRSVVVEAPALGLLGTSMSFSVEGISAEGLRGNPTSDHACTQSFRRPDASAISVTGSATPGPGRTVTATIDVSPPAGGSAGALTYGSQSTDFAYDVHPLSGRGPTFTQTTTRTAATFTGLPPGVPYQATVTVTPAGHAGDAVAVTSPPFSSDIPWPALATTPPQVTRGPDFTAGTVAVAFTGLAADTYVANQVALSCDGATQPVGEQVPLQGSRLTVEVDDLVTFGGTNCRLLVGSLTDEGPDSPYGSGRSPTGVSVPFGFPAAPTYQFQAAYGTESCPGGVGPIQLQCPDVSVRAAQGDDPGDQWVVAVQGSGQDLHGRACTGTVRGQQPTLQDPVVVALPYGCAGPATATVSWHYYGQPQPAVTLTPGGSAPTTTSTSSTTTSSTTTSSTTAPSSASTGSTGAVGARSATLAAHEQLAAADQPVSRASCSSSSWPRAARRPPPG